MYILEQNSDLLMNGPTQIWIPMLSRTFSKLYHLFFVNGITSKNNKSFFHKCFKLYFNLNFFFTKVGSFLIYPFISSFLTPQIVWLSRQNRCCLLHLKSLCHRELEYQEELLQFGRLSMKKVGIFFEVVEKKRKLMSKQPTSILNKTRTWKLRQIQIICWWNRGLWCLNRVDLRLGFRGWWICCGYVWREIGWWTILEVQEWLFARIERAKNT